jgi:hypothetical protein
MNRKSLVVKKLALIGLLLAGGLVLLAGGSTLTSDGKSPGGTIKLDDAGAPADGETEATGFLQSLLEELGDTRATLLVNKGRFLVKSVTLPANITLAFRDGGKIVVPQGETLRINGSIEAGIETIFEGDGSVLGSIDNLYVYPQWFGARGDGKHDDSRALQQAADLAADAGGRTLFIPRGEYLFSDNIDIRANVESRGVLLRDIAIDEDRTEFSTGSFLYDHFATTSAAVRFLPDHSGRPLDPAYFYGVEEGDFTVPVYRDVPLADGNGTVDLAEGGVLIFQSSDFFTSRDNNKGDEWYDRNDITQLVSGRGEVFPEFAFSYAKPPEATAWSAGGIYQKGDYVSWNGQVFKAAWPSGRGTVVRHGSLGEAPVGPVEPRDAETVTHSYAYADGTRDSVNVWRRVNTSVSYVPRDAPIEVNNLRIVLRLRDNDGTIKRLRNANALTIRRSNAVFNNLEVSVRDREAHANALVSVSNAVNVEFNRAYVSGATYHGLGYNILNFNVANIRYNDGVSLNSRKGMDGRHGKNITVDGGFYNFIDDHYGRNMTIKNVIFSGVSTFVPGYTTPKADIDNWEFRPSKAIGFSGANLRVHNCVFHGDAAIFVGRGDTGDLYGKIELKDITVYGNTGDILLFWHKISPKFDFAHQVRVPGQVIIEDISLENPGKLNMTFGQGLKGGMVEVRHTGPIGNVYTSGDSSTFINCRFEGSTFNVPAGSHVNLINNVFSGSITGLTTDHLGRSSGNVIKRGGVVSFPLDYINPEAYDPPDPAGAQSRPLGEPKGSGL